MNEPNVHREEARVVPRVHGEGVRARVVHEDRAAAAERLATVGRPPSSFSYSFGLAAAFTALVSAFLNSLNRSAHSFPFLYEYRKIASDKKVALLPFPMKIYSLVILKLES